MSMPSAARPPAVVLGVDTPIGLTIIRDLGRGGVPVYGIGRSAGALGLASRFLHRGLTRAGGEEALVLQLLALGAELGHACLFAVGESDIALLNRHRDRLSAYTCLFADDARMRLVLNKDQTYAAAAGVGIRVPRTEQVSSLAQAEQVSTELRFPVVLKWGNPHEVQRRLAAIGVELDKTQYCHTRAELLAYLRRFEPIASYPLIQEYCAGYGLGQFVLMKDGQAHYAFQHRRVHEWPPEGGFSSLCESVPLEQHQALMGKSIALLRALNWDGIAMVEYRHDPLSGESALMEINGRYWGSLPLAYHAGARFPWMSYLLMGLGEPVQQSPYRAGVRCRFMVPETKRLLRILFGQHKIADQTLRFHRIAELASYFAEFFRLRSNYFVFELRDPRPFFSDLAQMIKKLR